MALSDNYANSSTSRRETLKPEMLIRNIHFEFKSLKLSSTLALDQHTFSIDVPDAVLLTPTILLHTLPVGPEPEETSRISFSYSQIASVEATDSQLTIMFKHFAILVLIHPSIAQIYTTINTNMRIAQVGALLAFNIPSKSHSEYKYDPVLEYNRFMTPNWRFSSINSSFQFSPTYPQVLVVPSRISDNVLKHIGSFRNFD
jgi:Myotubularin-like phosphatase domain